MTLVTGGDEAVIEQITKQLHKLVDVVKLMDLTDGRHIQRELMLVKVEATGEAREEVKRLVDIFRGNVVDVGETLYTVELTGAGGKLDAFLEALSPNRIVEVVRSGISGIARGGRALTVR
ncbi:MAG: acetolactate synthase small subunit, partial [Gammaproteobacteria bacterium]|nr:acetolactate synthase small subunit [Gammaproteobacteria bacterium]